jgi:hypothetical protein
MESGVATRPISDFDAYRQQLNNFVWQSGLVMKPVFQAAKRAPKRIIFSEASPSACCARCRRWWTKACAARS